MIPQAQQGNQEFGIPADVEARLRAQAEQDAVKGIDEVALLARYTAEAKAKREEELRAQAGVLADEASPDLDSLGFPKKYVKLQIFKGSAKSELSYVPIGVNGYFWKIQRGVQVIVHSVVADALNEAVTEQVLQAEGGLITQPVHRFPYQVVGEATQAEYEAFRAQMKQAGKTAAVL